jgi:hypothetical protein
MSFQHFPTSETYLASDNLEPLKDLNQNVTRNSAAGANGPKIKANRQRNLKSASMVEAGVIQQPIDSILPD